jgi:PAS domain S-box-containing protein
MQVRKWDNSRKPERNPMIAKDACVGAARRRAQPAYGELPDCVRASPVAVVAIDRSGVLIGFSAGAEALLGHHRAEALGQQVSELLVPGRLRAVYEASFGRYVATAEASLADQGFQVPVRRADGTELLVELVVSRVSIAGKEVFAGLLWEAGGDGPGADPHLLEERDRFLAEQAALRTQFVAAVSHELRTPLTSIVAFADMVQGLAAYSAVDRDVAAAGISRNAERMLRLVDDLVLLANLEFGTVPLNVTAIDLPLLVRGAVEGSRAEAGSREVTVGYTAADGPELAGDRKRIEQLVDTLLAAAISAVAAGGQVNVSTRYEYPQWIFELVAGLGEDADCGPGEVRPEDGDPALMTQGSALAFLLGRAIVFSHGGELTAARTPSGISFLVRLPVRDESTPAS